MTKAMLMPEEESRMSAEKPTLDWVAVPWHVAEGPAQVRHRDGWLVCEVPSDDYAKLISAAPDMLEALKAARGALGANAARDAVDAAIAKATGEPVELREAS